LSSIFRKSLLLSAQSFQQASLHVRQLNALFELL
jgi:hypothetical protein